MSKRLARAATHQALDQLPAMMNMEIDNQFQQNVIDSEEKDTKYSALNRRMDYIAALDGCIEIIYVSSLVVTGSILLFLALSLLPTPYLNTSYPVFSATSSLLLLAYPPLIAVLFTVKQRVLRPLLTDE